MFAEGDVFIMETVATVCLFNYTPLYFFIIGTLHTMVHLFVLTEIASVVLGIITQNLG